MELKIRHNATRIEEFGVDNMPSSKVPLPKSPQSRIFKNLTNWEEGQKKKPEVLSEGSENTQ